MPDLASLVFKFQTSRTQDTLFHHKGHL